MEADAAAAAAAAAAARSSGRSSGASMSTAAARAASSRLQDAGRQTEPLPRHRCRTRELRRGSTFGIRVASVVAKCRICRALDPLCCRDSTGPSVSSTALALAAASRSCQESWPINCGSSSSSSKQVGRCRFPAAKTEATALPAIDSPGAGSPLASRRCSKARRSPQAG